MDEEKHKEAERFIEEFKLMEFQVSLENMKREVVKIGDAHMYKDLYLIEKLLPTLVEGLEQLSREVENLMNDESTSVVTPDYVDPDVRKRFNPCTFLAQHLMRNNHTSGTGAQTHLTKLFLNYCQVEKFSRMFVKKHDAISKLFVGSIGVESKSCDSAQMKLFVRDLDDALRQGGALKEAMAASKLLSKIKGEIKLADILDELARYAAAKGMKEADFDDILGGK